MAAQEHTIYTWTIQHHIDKTGDTARFMLYIQRKETLPHVVFDCNNLVQTLYKKQYHDKIAHVICWQMCKLNGLDQNEKWLEYRPKHVAENDALKLIWHMKIQTDEVIENSKPDIVTFDKTTREWKNYRCGLSI